ncbi:class I SAM-dependent methyltransferase [Desulfonatronum parangueonense]
MQHGDFTELADNYAKYRPGYSPFVLDALLGLCPIAPHQLEGADVGAGTGIWTRQMAERGVRMSAVEPNEAMRSEGVRQNGTHSIAWHKGTAEQTGLPSNSFDIASMASSFHWPDFDAAVMEFDRILKPEGLFIALWNTRRFESNPLLLRIEEKLKELVPDLKRVSSGRSEFCDGLLDRLKARSEFSDVLHLEARHVEEQTPERYLGLWKSVNDVRVQAGEKRFSMFLDYIRNETAELKAIQAEYVTRAWIARKKG